MLFEFYLLVIYFQFFDPAVILIVFMVSRKEKEPEGSEGVDTDSISSPSMVDELEMKDEQ